MSRRALLASALAFAVAALAAYAAHRLWLKSDDLTRPVVVAPGDDAAALAHPSLARRLAALTASAPQIAARERLIALTFDDGPYPITTPLLLQTLRDLGVPATFFLIGRDAEQFPALTAEVRAAGFEIGDHTLTHPDLDRLDAAAVTAELRGGSAALERLAPEPSERRLFRPPHGRYTAATLAAAQAAGYTTVLWTDDPGDWRDVGSAALAAHIRSRATAPEVLLLHSGRPATIAMLPGVVRDFRAAGYTFVTAGTLLAHVPAGQLARPARRALPGR